MRFHRWILSSAAVFFVSATAAFAASPVGYYRQPALHKDTIVLTAEGDLWKIGANGGVASRLTTHRGDESLPAISPDGQTLAFLAHYDGPAEVYTMPLSGGLPQRRTYDAGRVTFVGWTPDGKVLYSTNHFSTLPAHQLVTLDIGKKNGSASRSLVPLAQAADGCYDDTGRTLYFTRLPFQGSHTKRYQGGTAQNLWKFTDGEPEAVPLSADYKGTSKNPMWWQGRVYFASDRDGTMNIWSMKPDGSELKQHTRHAGWDVASPALHDGKIVYQLGADIRLYDIAADRDRLVPIQIDSDFDQTRERWLRRPTTYLTSSHIAADGSKVALTARGRVFVAPARQGRFVEVTRKEGVRYRDARFLPDGKTLLAMSDESGEVEFWKLPANGIGEAEQFTRDGQVLRWEGIPSPDGKWIAHHDKNQRLFVFDVEKKKNQQIEESKIDDFSDLAWSPDSQWLAYAAHADNTFRQVKLYHVANGKTTALTTDRFDSHSPAWSPNGKWIYLLSDRNLSSIVGSPWGTYQPEPFLDKKTKIYQIALRKGLRSPFKPADELFAPEKKEPAKEPAKPDGDKKEAKKPATPMVAIDLDGIQQRIQPVPVPPGNYRELTVNDKALFWLSRETGGRRGARSGGDMGNEALMALPITNETPELKTIVDPIKSYELSQDGKKILFHRGDDLFVIDALAVPVLPAELAKKEVNLSNWSLSVIPREEWRQMFVEAWRLERDYFYDRGMHGVDWLATRKKYEPLVDRVTSRAELSDLIAQMVSELSALHIFVRGGDLRAGTVEVQPSSLGAVLERDDEAGGCRVVHIYQHDPDEPERAGPLSRPNVNVKEGDIIESVNGRPTLSVPDIDDLLRHKAGQQVLLRVKSKRGASRDMIVNPITTAAAADLRYHEWEHTRRLAVEKQGKGDIGYVHLRAMGGGNFTEWAKNFYPVFTRKGLIIDMRYNRGGNIDSWIISRLLRKAWFHWNARVGQPPRWNMQYAFRGHIVVICNEDTASDGEAFTEGIKRLGLGKVIGTRTWGGEIWLSSSNFLVDRGIATAAEFGVYGPEGNWLIEGHGVEPDIVVDNLPHATFKGEDAQLRAAIAYLQKTIKENPVEVPPIPPFPNKALKAKAAAK